MITAVLKSEADHACFRVQAVSVPVAKGSRKKVSVWVDNDGLFICKRGCEAPLFSILSVNGKPVEKKREEVHYPLGILSR